MFEESNIEDVEQSENNEVTSLTAEPPETLEEAGFEGWGIGDADTAEGMARRAEEAHLEEVKSDKVAAEIEDLKETVEDLPPLPTAEEADLGQLHRNSEGYFDQCELIDSNTADLIGVLEEDENDDEDLSILEEIESEFETLTGGEN